ncbi:hypothetical protein V6N13_049774 [Hibiscus sabdariffa]
MKFNMLVKSSKGRIGWGSADVLTIDNQFSEQTMSVVSASTINGFQRPTKWEPQDRANISYKIDIKLHTRPKLTDESYESVVPEDKLEIAAEGIYDADTGGLCMVGCRKFASIDQAAGNAPMDCNILLNGGYVRGRIESAREESDLLYFDHLDVSSVAYSREQARHSIWTMDLEIVMVVISQTLTCLFIRSQLYHAKRHPKTLPKTSLVMLVILTLGQLIPLVLNYEALFNRKHNQETLLFQTGGWLEANEVIVRITSMVAFLLQFRFLQQAFSSRAHDRSQKGLWFAEKMTLLVTLSLYISGAFIVLLVYRGNYKREIVLLPFGLIDYWQNRMQVNLRRDHSYVQYKGVYIYVNPADVFFSTGWDVVIILSLLVFCYLLQSFTCSSDLVVAALFQRDLDGGKAMEISRWSVNLKSLRS